MRLDRREKGIKERKGEKGEETKYKQITKNK